MFSRIGEYDKAFQDRVSESIHLEIEELCKWQKEQRNAERVLKIIKSIDVKDNEKKSLTDFGEESDDWLALQRLDLREVEQHSELINRLKTDIIKYELTKIEEGMSNDASGFIAGRFTLELLTNATYHSDKSISRRAKTIKRKVENIIRDDILRKYTEQTEIRYLTFTERAVLRNLPISKREGLRYPHQVNKFFWLLLEDDLEKTNKMPIEGGQDRDSNKRFHNKLQILLQNPSTPQPLRAKIKQFLEKTDEPSTVVDQELEENKRLELLKQKLLPEGFRMERK